MLNPLDTKPNKKSNEKAYGEPFIWLSALGLTAGLLMVFSLLMVITYNGVLAFWPKDVVVVELEDDSPFKIMGATTLGGEITRQNTRRMQVTHPDGTFSMEFRPEKQIHVGNRDVYGFAFKYLDLDERQKISYPEKMLKIERVEYGSAFGLPVKLSMAGENALSAEDAAFDKKFHDAVEEFNAKRAEIKDIEKFAIGRINYNMDNIKIERKRLARNGVPEGSEAFKKLDEQENELQGQYAKLAEKAQKLRAEQIASTLTYRLPTGQEHTIPIGNIIHYYYPNSISLFDKIMLFLSNIYYFLVDEPREANMEGGIFPAIFGTTVMTLLLSIIVTPFGVVAAIYLREYAKQGPMVRAVRIAINNLAGVPSIVFGVFGLGFFVYMVGGTIDSIFYIDRLPTPTYGTGGILWCSLTLALMTVPVVIVATEESLAAVPRGSREGSLACGASKWQTMQRIVLPASAPGILTGLILAMARGAGEVAPLMLIGVVKLAPSLPLDEYFPYVHLDRKFMHLGFHIFDLGFQSPDSEAARPMVFATTLFLIVLVIVLNLTAILIREHLRKKYATGSF